MPDKFIRYGIFLCHSYIVFADKNYWMITITKTENMLHAIQNFMACDSFFLQDLFLRV